MKVIAQILLVFTLSVFTANMLKQVFSIQKTEQSMAEKDLDDNEDDSENDDDETRTEIEWFFIEQESIASEIGIVVQENTLNVDYQLSLIVSPYSKSDGEPPEC